MPCRSISDNVNARSATMNMVHLPKTGNNTEKKYYGVQFISGDTERVRGWDLLTHGGFLTYPHHDASGNCTYVTVRSGSKIWAYIDTPGKTQQPSKQVFKKWDALFAGTSEAGNSECPMGVLILSRGDTLCVPSSHTSMWSP